MTALVIVLGAVGAPLPYNYVKLCDVPEYGYYAKNNQGEVCFFFFLHIVLKYRDLLFGSAKVKCDVTVSPIILRGYSMKI